MTAPLLALPDELFTHIGTFLDWPSIRELREVSRKFRVLFPIEDRIKEVWDSCSIPLSIRQLNHFTMQPAGYNLLKSQCRLSLQTHGKIPKKLLKIPNNLQKLEIQRAKSNLTISLPWKKICLTYHHLQTLHFIDVARFHNNPAYQHITLTRNEIVHLKQLSQLTDLDLRIYEISEECLTVIGSLPLQKFYLGLSSNQNPNLDCLQNMTLQELGIEISQNKGSFLLHWKTKTLTKLSFSSSLFDPEALQELLKFNNLTELRLETSLNSPLSRETLVKLQAKGHLKKFSFRVLNQGELASIFDIPLEKLIIHCREDTHLQSLDPEDRVFAKQVYITDYQRCTPQHLKKFCLQTTTELTLYLPSSTKEILTPVQAMKSLRKLTLVHSIHTKEFLEPLRGMESLEELAIRISTERPSENFSIESISAYCQSIFPNLEYLTITVTFGRIRNHNKYKMDFKKQINFVGK